jgi:hypothetical protein
MGEVLGAPGGEIVEDDYLVAVGQQPVDEMAADEAGPSGDKRLRLAHAAAAAWPFMIFTLK